MVVLLTIRVNCSCWRAKPAHFVGHLPHFEPGRPTGIALGKTWYGFCKRLTRTTGVFTEEAGDVDDKAHNAPAPGQISQLALISTMDA